MINLAKKLIKYLYEYYLISIVFLLKIVLSPIIILSSVVFPKYIHEFILFRLISFSNFFFVLERNQSTKNNILKHNLRDYRDEYDRKGIDLYFKHYSPQEIISNKKILDIGCGVGGKDFELLKYNPKKIVGVDLSERNISYAKELINHDNNNTLYFLNKNIYNITQKFDTIISYTVFEHIEKNQLLPTLNQIFHLLKPAGIAVIVFNHFNDKFGTHLKEYIYHPWPQTLFPISVLFRYWNYKLSNDDKLTEESYFPIDYRHGVTKHNSDCYMNLNKVTVEEFKEIIYKSKLVLNREYYYSKSIFLKTFPFLPEKYLLGSVVYYLTKK